MAKPFSGDELSPTLPFDINLVEEEPTKEGLKPQEAKELPAAPAPPLAAVEELEEEPASSEVRLFERDFAMMHLESSQDSWFE